MDNKTLNALDGSHVLAVVMSEKIEAKRRLYKKAIKDAAIRNDNAQAMADKTNARADKNQAKLDALVNGGMEGFFSDKAREEEDQDGTGMDSLISGRSSRKSSFWSSASHASLSKE
jgi:hypothetical protein